MESSYSIYCHIPFCIHRCGYCDFNTYAGLEALIPEYARALRREIELLADSADHPLSAHTLYFGGGTPSLLTALDYETILNTLQRVFILHPSLEVTVEANPGTVSLTYLKDIHHLGINRLSLGAQSTNDGELRLLERLHTWTDVHQAVDWARQAGFDHINLDFIFGLPGQSLATWETTLSEAICLQPEHFSLYSLTLEPGTRLQRRVSIGSLSTPDPDAVADMYETASELLEKHGYTQYEISNWAKSAGSQLASVVSAPLFACKHNLQYWLNRPYFGFGAGAHGYAGNTRTVNILSPEAYVVRCLEGEAKIFPRTPATVKSTPIDRRTEIGETMMMGLRLTRQGISRDQFYARFGLHLDVFFNQPIEKLMKSGLLEWTENHLRLTQRGRLLGNQVFMEFI